MILHTHGLDWDVPSPSFYRLRLPKPNQDVIDISFTGDVWILFLEHNGRVSTQSFDNRDQAIGMVAEAFTREGM